MDELKFLTEQVYDFLMQNGDVRMDFVKNFPEGYLDYDDCAIYLKGSDTLKSYKLVLKEI